MKLLETYSCNCSVDINHKPHILENFFPLGEINKYITLQNSSGMNSKNYKFYQDVVDFIFPILEREGIKIILLGEKDSQPLKKVIDLRGQTDLHQTTYIAKRALLHLGNDSWLCHFCAAENIPLVALYGPTTVSNHSPFHYNQEKTIFLESHRDGNSASFAREENPRTIDYIKPEDIANAIFKLLNIDFQIPFKTLYTGGKYGNGMVRQLIPNTTGMISDPQEPVEIRMDIVFDEKILTHHLSYLTKALIITNKPISIDLLKHFKKNIQVVAYKITENDEPKFVENLIGASLPVVLISELSDEKLKDKKLNYYEYGTINPMDISKEKVIEELKKESNLYYRSSLLIANEKSIFASHAAIENGIPLTVDGEYQKLIDSPKFWKDIEFYTIVKYVLTKEQS
jgi:hypothetical protein